MAGPADPDALEVALASYRAAGGDLSLEGVRDALRGLAEQAPGLLSLAVGDVELLPEVMASDPRRAPSRGDALAPLMTLAERLGDGPELRRALRRHRHRGVIRIALREILGLADVAATSAEMADLASDCVEVALRAARASCTERYGRAVDRAGEEIPMVVLGMGKLGGRELNVGSDIDICFFYGSDDGEVESGELTIHGWMSKVATLTTAALAEPTRDGFCFRVDLRLRPEGSQGAMANSLASAERYYEAFGRTWERAAMLRARPVAGDRALGEELLTALTPFIYRREVDPELPGEMAAMLERSRRELGGEDDVKLGRGGIREAEWVVQTLQLVWGGQRPELRVQGTALALRRLAGHGLLPAGAAEGLAADWAFLRALEHRVQVRAGYPTHALPAPRAELDALARSLGLGGGDALRARLEQTRGRVASLFAEVCGEPPDLPRVELDALADAVADGRGEQELRPEVERLLAPRDVDAATTHLRRLGLRATAPLGPAGRREAPALGRQLLAEVARVPDPELALRHLADFFQRAGDLGHVRALARAPRQTRRLVGLLGTSATLSEALIGHPDALDRVLAGDAAPSPAAIARAHRALSYAPGADAARDFVPALRRLARETKLLIGLADAAGELSREQRREALTSLAEAQVRAAFDYAAAETYARQGRPEQRPGTPPAGLSCVALGRLGEGEMAFGSDLDLIFVYGVEGVCPQRGKSYAEIFTKVARQCLRLLSAHDAEGPGWKTDARLRPEGERGTLVVSLAGFERYHAEHAGGWERQALLRARAVAGDPSLGKQLDARLIELALARGAPDAGEMGSMRSRLERELGREGPSLWHPKFGYGARLDAELLTQALYMNQVARGVTPAPSGRPTRREIFTALRAGGVLGTKEVEALSEALRFFDDVQEAMRLLDERLPERLNPRGQVALRVARRLGLHARDEADAAAALGQTWRLHAELSRALFERHVGPVGTVPPWRDADPEEQP